MNKQDKDSNQLTLKLRIRPDHPCTTSFGRYTNAGSGDFNKNCEKEKECNVSKKIWPII